jgi:hypothetical protein
MHAVMRSFPLQAARVVLVLVASLVGATSLRAQVAVSPATVTLQDTADAATSIVVRNEGTTVVQLKVYAGDFDQNADGSHAFTDLRSHASSCADRLEFGPGALTLQPGAVGSVTVRLAGGGATCWSMIWLESAMPATGGVHVAQRVGVKVHAATGSAQPMARFLDVFVPDETSSARGGITLSLENDGTLPLRPEGRIEIRTFAGETVAEVPVLAFSLLPGRIRDLLVPFDTSALPAGDYLAIPILDIGAPSLLAAQREFTVRR